MNLNLNVFKTIQIEEKRGIVNIEFSRSENNNSINNTLIQEVSSFINQIEKNNEIKIVVLKGNQSTFCTGMDFKAIANHTDEAMTGEDDPVAYYELLKMISLSSKIFIAAVEGKVNAGGIGIVAACDFVLAGENSTFGLSEALFGLLPACVLPFLIQRVGFQKAKWLTLVTYPINVEKASSIGLVDEYSSDLENLLRITSLRLLKLENETVSNLKKYMSKLWIINDNTQEIAVEKIKGLIQSDKVQTNIYNFVHHNKFPWEK